MERLEFEIIILSGVFSRYYVNSVVTSIANHSISFPLATRSIQNYILFKLTHRREFRRFLSVQVHEIFINSMFTFHNF